MDNPITPTPEASRSRLDALRAVAFAPALPSSEPDTEIMIAHCVDATTQAIQMAKASTEELTRLRQEVGALNARSEAVAAKLHAETRTELARIRQSDEWKMISETYGSALVTSDNTERVVRLIIILLVILTAFGVWLIYYLTHGGNVA